MKAQINLIFLIFAIWILSGCTETKLYKNFSNDTTELNNFDNHKNSDSEILIFTEKQDVQHKCDKATIKANNLTLSQFAALLSNLYDVSINYSSNIDLTQSPEGLETSKSNTFSESASEKIYLNMNDVCLLDVLDQVTETYNIGFNKSHYGYTIHPKQLRTKTFSLNYSSIIHKTQEDFWLGITEAIKSILTINKGSSESFYVHKETGLIIVTAYPKQLHYIQNFLNKINQNATSQVLIEVKILEVDLHDKFINGIQWDLINSKLNTNISDKKSFNKIIQTLSEQGQISILSSPLVRTLNNQKAIVKSGYFVTNLLENDSSTPNSTTNTSTQSGLELQQFFFGAILEVSPTILGKKEMLLHIHPTTNQGNNESQLINLDNKGNKSPVIFTQLEELDAVVKAKSGDIIILGGLKPTNTKINKSRSLFNGFFLNKKKSVNRTELIFLIKPTITSEFDD